MGGGASAIGSARVMSEKRGESHEVDGMTHMKREENKYNTSEKRGEQHTTHVDLKEEEEEN